MVLADGCFDPFHVGHLRYLHAAASARLRGEAFAVRIAPDAVIRAKGREPFQTVQERARCITAFCCQDVQCHTGPSLASAVRTLKPRVLVKGWDWFQSLPADVIQACEEVGTAVAFVQTQERTSTERLG